VIRCCRKGGGLCSLATAGECQDDIQTRHRHLVLSIEPSVALFGQLFELFILLIDAVGYPLFVLFTCSAGCLFDQLPDVALKDRDPIIEFRK
jgi:hypothetical protein